MNVYECVYYSRHIKVRALSSYQAQQLAVERLGVKPKDAYRISVLLVEKDGAPVVHKPDF